MDHLLQKVAGDSRFGTGSRSMERAEASSLNMGAEEGVFAGKLSIVVAMSKCCLHSGFPAARIFVPILVLI